MLTMMTMMVVCVASTYRRESRGRESAPASRSLLSSDSPWRAGKAFGVMLSLHHLFVFWSHCLSLFFWPYLLVFLSVCLSVNLFHVLDLCLSNCLSACLSNTLDLGLPLALDLCLSLSVCLFFCLSFPFSLSLSLSRPLSPLVSLSLCLCLLVSLSAYLSVRLFSCFHPYFFVSVSLLSLTPFLSFSVSRSLSLSFCLCLSHRLVGLVVRRPPRERKVPGSNPACAGIFFGVESYLWLKHWHSSGYPARRLAL